ncbi:ester cyclase [Yeosuana marina]|uniref:ester cyclase n=1 Tax=Yeosuana marina TaxID=1565536 RepID=UPI0030EEF77B
MMNKESFIKEFMNEIWNKKKVDSIAKYVHKEYTIHLDEADPWEGKTLTHSEFKERLNFSFNSFPDMNFEITSVIPEEHHVAITWILTGTNLGFIGLYPPTKKTINTKGTTIYHFKNNLINGHTQVFNRVTVMKQLGFI